LKPAHGSLGLGIIRVERMSGGGMHYTVYRSGIHHGRASSAAEFLHRTQGSRKQMLYIVQQGIDLARVAGSVFDLRVILQKDRHGEWRLTKRVARIAPPGSQVSNLRRGGRAVSGERVMRRLFRNNKSLLQEKNDELLTLCIMIADTIEQKSGKIFGELGLDIGIDNSRRWWLIEVNSKPRKTTETEASQRIMRQSFLRPLEYATWLAGF
ncbi:MAG: YheC/YheD family protein, partial [Syntrophomonadaceae bacterium]|nr:YheC/YheD family protein [Syntrophomonadaceae bacterium]